jgi:hypothetical protein
LQHHQQQAPRESPWLLIEYAAAGACSKGSPGQRTHSLRSFTSLLHDEGRVPVSWLPLS